MAVRKISLLLSVSIFACVLPLAGIAQAAAADRPWTDTSLSVEARTQALLGALTQEEKLKLVFGLFSTDAAWKNFKMPVGGLPQAAGFIEGAPRVGLPNLLETDAGIGVASQVGPNPRYATALPSNLATAATWDPEAGFAGGQMIGDEARRFGFNIMLAGGVNLDREPRNGRNFEYGGEDPLLAGVMVGAQVRGVQSNHIISTVKHYAFNDQESHRNDINAKVDDTVARTSDLLAFQIAIEQGHPGSIMCGYNRTNGVYNCENPWLLTEVLKKDWGFKGFVMSDWGGTHSTIPAANAGLDQESGYPFDVSPYFSDALKEAVEDGYVSKARLDDMAGRILHAVIENGLLENPVGTGNIDFKAHAAVARADAEAGIVLLKNDRKLLPIAKSVKTIAIIGAHADAGVLSGGGSSQVYPVGGFAVPNPGPKAFPGPIGYFPSSPLKFLAEKTHAKITYNDGTDPAAAAKLAASSDLVIVFAQQWNAEGQDASLTLSDNQDALISSVASANPKTVVVLETGGAVLMPWLDKVGAVVEAWYPGASGGEAIANVLSGEVNPSGRLPISFPASVDQLPRPVLDGFSDEKAKGVSVDYGIEGAAVGYKWYDLKGYKPLFPFGHGLSYSKFVASNLAAEVKDRRLTVSFKIKNKSGIKGKDVAEVFVAPATPGITWEAPKRLGAFKKIEVKPGKTDAVSVTVDPRLLAVYDSKAKTWTVAEGDYAVSLAGDAATPLATVKVHLPKQVLDVRGQVQ